MDQFNVRVATLHCMTVKQSVMWLPLQKFGLAARLRKIRARHVHGSSNSLASSQIHCCSSM